MALPIDPPSPRTMSPFADLGFLLMDIAKMCNVDAARIVSGDALAHAPPQRDAAGFHVVAAELFQAPDGTRARLMLLSRTPRQLTERERVTLRAMALHAQMQLI